MPHIHARPSTRRPSSRPHMGVREDPTTPANSPGPRRTYSRARTDTPQPQTIRNRAHRHRRMRPRTLRHTQYPSSATNRGTRRRAENSQPDAYPKQGAHCTHARPRVPAPSRPSPSGAGRTGGGSCGTAREAARGWAAAATSSPSSSSWSKPAEWGQGQGRAEGSEGAGGARHRAMAHQTGIHGEGRWRAGRGRRVSARGCAPSPALSPSPPRHWPGEASCSLLQPRVAWGGHIWGDADFLYIVGSGCTRTYTAGVEVSVCPSRGGCACVCPSICFSFLGAVVPGCAHLEECARMCTCLVCAHLDVTACVCLGSFMHMH